MAPSQLIISKLGVQATVSGDTVTGLLCLKISIPREGEGRQVSRYGLFNGNKPLRLTHPPEIHPLPLPPNPSPTYRTASRLLGLDSSYPPPQTSTSGWKPVLDVSSTTGQVFLVLDPRRSSPSKRDGGTGRRDWLVLMRFEQSAERCIERGSQQVILGLPKCLDNVIRFQILSPPAGPSTGPSGEVSILTEPRILPVPASSFAGPSSPRRLSSRKPRAIGAEEGWEDGEDLGPDGEDSEDEEGGTEDSEEEGSWLEGRFQSTESLRLEWSFGGASTSSSLTVIPKWDPRHPTIAVSFDSPTKGYSVPIEAVLPDGWGWSSLSIRGENLVSWSSIDGDWWDEVSQPGQEQYDDSTTTEIDDSFSTIRQRRPTPTPHTPARSLTPSYERSSASLMRQPIPAGMGRMEDFSFEMSSNSIDTTRISSSTPSLPYTPSPAGQGVAPGSPISPAVVHMRRPINGPAAAKLFDLVFSESTGSVVFEGVLAPVSKLTLVSQSFPTAIPFVRIDDGESPARCELSGPFNPDQTSSRQVDVASPDIGNFSWKSDGPSAISEPGRMNTDVTVKVVKDTWGVLTQHITFVWPKRAAEVGFIVPSKTVRIQRVTKAGTALARATALVDGGTAIRLGLGSGGNQQGKDGVVEVVLEVRGEEQGGELGIVAIPRFEGAGRLLVDLKGNWDLEKHTVKTNMTVIASGRFQHALSAPPPMLSIEPIPGFNAASPGSWARRLFSTRSIINLFLLYLVISLAQQVQRLRTEVAYVAEEARDLRLYGLASSVGSVSTYTSTETATTTATFTYGALPTDVPFAVPYPANGDRARRDELAIPREVRDVRTSLGRVVFGRSAWDKWATHPTVQTLSRSLGWVWHAVVWLVIPT